MNLQETNSKPMSIATPVKRLNPVKVVKQAESEMDMPVMDESLFEFGD